MGFLDITTSLLFSLLRLGPQAQRIIQTSISKLSLQLWVNDICIRFGQRQ
jgi:hypothetical protein